MDLATKVENILGELVVDEEFEGDGAYARIENSEYAIQQQWYRDVVGTTHKRLVYHVWRLNDGGYYIQKDFKDLRKAILCVLVQDNYNPDVLLIEKEVS